MTNQYEQWVRDGQVVNAIYAMGSGVHATGRVIAYVDRPTVVIQTPSGARVSWIADMCLPLAAQPTETAYQGAIPPNAAERVAVRARLTRPIEPDYREAD